MVGSIHEVPSNAEQILDESREWAQDAIDVLAIAAVLLLVAFIAFL